MNCASCRFHESDGSCRRYPPTSSVMLIPGRVQGTMSPESFTSAPIVQDDFWCGEWQASPSTLKLAS